MTRKDTFKKDFLKMLAELEFNATEDSLFERMTLTRLRSYADNHFGTTLEADSLAECSQLTEWFESGKKEVDWRREILKKRLKQAECI